MPDTKPAPVHARAYWNATAPIPQFPRLKGEITVDVAIIGGGIVGISTARAAKDLGLSVAVVEARRVGRQVTGKSTAKVTSQHKLIYRRLKSKFGTHRARLYADAQETGLRRIKRLVLQYKLDCDLESRAAFVYTCDSSHVAALEEELEVAREFGLPASLVSETGLPFEVKAALRFDDQAQFHPSRYVAGLATTIPGQGCHVFEDSRVVDWDPTRIETGEGCVTAPCVVMSTHLPLGQIGGFYAQTHPHAEPVVAAPLGRVPDGMYISAEQPTRSIRTHKQNGEIFGIAAGPGFKPGDSEEERAAFDEIERWLLEKFDAGPIAYRWVNEDYSSIDGAPFIGWSSSKGEGYLVATGFGAWGITNGTAAGTILADLAAGKNNRWLEVFDATRVKPVASAPNFVTETLGAAARLVGGYIWRKPKSFDVLAPGEAAILKIDGENVAAYKDEKGRVHAVAAACSHMGCLVGWNETDHTWDCPCHGSRFELSGKVLHGPAIKPLTSKAAG